MFCNARILPQPITDLVELAPQNPGYMQGSGSYSCTLILAFGNAVNFCLKALRLSKASGHRARILAAYEQRLDGASFSDQVLGLVLAWVLGLVWGQLLRRSPNSTSIK